MEPNKAMNIYLVGGAVRDQLLGRPIKDKDWVITGATPQQLIALGYKPVGKDFPVFLHPETGEEYALARTERKTAKGYHGFQFYTEPSVTLEEDLIRRDLTINALAQNIQGEIIDYYGGLDDLNQRTLRHISSAFAEDPVRILRVARFAARYHYLGFHVAEETYQLMQSMVEKGEVNELTPERVWQELHTALNEPSPEVFIQVLQKSHALNILFPEFTFSTQALNQFAQACQQHTQPLIRFVALVTALFPTKEWELVQTFSQRIRSPKEYQQLASLTTQHYSSIQNVQGLSNTDILQLFQQTDAFRRPERFKQLLTTCDTAPIYSTLLQYLLEQCLAFPIQEVIKQGFQGAAIKEQLNYQYENIISENRNITKSVT